jgi:hypothetical protein
MWKGFCFSITIPSHDDDMIDRMVEQARELVRQSGKAMVIEGAREGAEILLEAELPARSGKGWEWSVNSDQPLSPRLVLFLFGDDASAAMRAFPVAPLEVSARVSDLFTTVLARYGDLFVFRHAAGITESCPECILGSAEGEKQCARLTVIRLATASPSKGGQGSTIRQGKQMSLFLFS